MPQVYGAKQPALLHFNAISLELLITPTYAAKTTSGIASAGMAMLMGKPDAFPSWAPPSSPAMFPLEHALLPHFTARIAPVKPSLWITTGRPSGAATRAVVLPQMPPAGASTNVDVLPLVQAALPHLTTRRP